MAVRKPSMRRDAGVPVLLGSCACGAPRSWFRRQRSQSHWYIQDQLGREQALRAAERQGRIKAEQALRRAAAPSPHASGHCAGAEPPSNSVANTIERPGAGPSKGSTKESAWLMQTIAVVDSPFKQRCGLPKCAQRVARSCPH